ncbi:aldehyde dehydrogenase family protein [Paraburkholderia sp. GAS32]|uniref:aldehyde dehydrogenase family protein n=1 Tax=Paraburkholderia sp. GAS32 TaxID=3035129 RepID=UPI003D2397C5
MLNPATEEVIALAPCGSVADAEAAISAARAAFDAGPWAAMSVGERVRYLQKMYDVLESRVAEICELIVLEAGAVQSNARARQFDIPMKHFRRFLELVSRQDVRAIAPELTRGAGAGTVLGTAFVVREPVGVVAAITPYNYPYFLNVVKVAAALITGNTVVLKPSPYTPFEALLLAGAAAEAGLPKGVLNVITGGKEAGERLTTDVRVDMVTFTGSDQVGAEIVAQSAPTLKRLVMELGGKSALIVRADANVKMALGQALRGFTSHAGQGCAMNTRVLVHNSLRKEFVEQLATMARAVKVGDPRASDTQMGPLIRAAARERVERYVALGVDTGAKLMAGGRRPPDLTRGFYYEPTFFDNVESQSVIAQDEIFGPVGVVIGFDSDDEAIRIANDSRFGLRGGIISADVGRAFEMACAIRTGGVTLNGGAGTQLSDGPFGGVKRSGYGRELGEDGLNEFTQTKLIEIQAG